MLITLMKSDPSNVPVVPKLQQLPHIPWSLTGVTAPSNETIANTWVVQLKVFRSQTKCQRVNKLLIIINGIIIFIVRNQAMCASLHMLFILDIHVNMLTKAITHM